MWEGHKTSTCIWNKSGLNLKLGAQCTNLLLRLVTRSSRVVSLIELPVSSFPHPVCTSSRPSGCLTYLKKSKCFSEKHSFYSVLYTNTWDALILLADSFYLVHTISRGSFFTVKEVTWVRSAFSAPMCFVVQWIRSSCLSIFKSVQICGSVPTILRGRVGLCWWIFRQEGWVWAYAPVLAQSCPALFNPVGCSPPGSSVYGRMSRQECRSRLPFPSPGDFLDPGIKPPLLHLLHW